MSIVQTIRNSSIKLKIVFLAALILILGHFISFFSGEINNSSQLEKRLWQATHNASIEGKEILNTYFEKSYTISNYLSELVSMNIDDTCHLSPEQIISIFKKTLNSENSLLGITCIVENHLFRNLQTLGQNVEYSDSSGNFSPWIFKISSGGIVSSNISYLNKDLIDNFYSSLRKEKKLQITNPYWMKFPYGEKQLVSFLLPILKNDRFYGMLKCDFEKINPLSLVNEHDAQLFDPQITIIDPNATIFSDSHFSDSVGRPLSKINPNWNTLMKNNLLGKKINPDTILSGNYIYQQSFDFLDIGTKWSIISSVSPSKYKALNSQSNTFGFLGTLLIISLCILGFYFVVKKTLSPIDDLQKYVLTLSTGNLNFEVAVENTGKEVQSFANSLQGLVLNLKMLAEFATSIGNENTESTYKLLSQDDALGKALLEMQAKIKQAKEEEAIRKIEDNKQTWMTKGQAMFSNVLRSNSNDLGELSYIFISNLVQYVKMDQGGLFLLNDSQPSNVVYELKSAFAYNRRKFLDKKVLAGEGLIGACIMEKQTIVLHQIPKDYIHISSGFGKTVPKILILTPLKIDNIILGVIELTSMNDVSEYEIEFIEKIAENFASTIAAVQNAENTKKLFEQSKRQAEELVAQEEEMHQNFEEMQATQDEFAKREAELRAIITGLKKSFLVSEFDMDGNFLDINDLFLNMLSKTKKEVIGTNLLQVSKNEVYNELWKTLKKGQVCRNVGHLSNKNKWFFENYIPIFDNVGHPFRVINVAVDISETKLHEEELQQKIEMLESMVK